MKMRTVLLLPDGHQTAIRYSITRCAANSFTARRFGRELWRGVPKFQFLREKENV